ncbi:MAG: DUF262 domain-containing protein [Bauldia sp.]|nr:DUF262 domain-containing protein [Bauldia sp.]
MIKKLKQSEWLSPEFQREFVWSTADVVALVNSIIDARPIGMITLWEQETDGALPLEPISIPDWDPIANRTGPKFFGDPTRRPGRYYALLDGRQRSTALALAFGGLRAANGLYRNSGRYFLDVAAADDAERVKFVPEKDVIKRRLSTTQIAISQGLFPLEVEDPDRIFDQWMSYLQYIRDSSFYPDKKLPTATELDRRDGILRRAFSGIIQTKIATYTVPRTYDLADICDIFATLNLTGTKVSTVDLIHSNLYSDTATTADPILLRDEIDELGELEGAVGWASSVERPELIAQFVAAMYVAAENKPAPRPIGGRREGRITSVKSRDLLALPAEHWRAVLADKPSFAAYIGAFQQAVAGGQFSLDHCPYPISAAIYVSLRWYLAHTPKLNWNQSHLDALFRAFFWRNALSRRYDQGFLTQLGTDLLKLKAYLNSTKSAEPLSSWAAAANGWLDGLVGTPVSRDQIRSVVTDGSEAGALRKAAQLLLYARAGFDVIDTTIPISYASGNLNLHHIYPKDWCANNVSGELANYLSPDRAGRDWVNSASNLMPMARTSNLQWRKKSPAQFIDEAGLSYDARPDLWTLYFVSKPAFEALRDGPDHLPEFWQLRAEALVDEMVHRMKV